MAITVRNAVIMIRKVILKMIFDLKYASTSEMSTERISAINN